MAIERNRFKRRIVLPCIHHSLTDHHNWHPFHDDLPALLDPMLNKDDVKLLPTSKKTMSDYTPVSCEAHSLYELAVMQRKRVLVRWNDSHGVKEMHLLPTDVETKNREEFLVALDRSNETLHIRLDRILSFQPEI